MRPAVWLTFAVLCWWVSPCAGQAMITTLAGSRYTFPAGAIAAVSAPVGLVRAVTADSRGNVYLADQTTDRVFRIDTSGTLTTFAGNGVNGYAGDGGPATSASLSNPTSLGVDPGGNLYIGDSGNFLIRKVTPAGIISTFAGNGVQGFSGDGGQAVAASLGAVTRIAVDSQSFVWIADTDNHRIRRVTTDGIIRTVAGTGTAATAGDEGPAVQASLQTPAGLALDAVGNLYIADTAAQRVREITVDGNIHTVAGTGVFGNTGDNGPATKARLSHPQGVAVDRNFSVYIANQTASNIRKVDSFGNITTLAGTGADGLGGDGGPAATAALYNPLDLFAAPSGALLVADWQNFRVRSIANGTITTIAGNGNYRYTGDGGPSTNATLPGPTGLAIDAAGDVNICDYFANRVRTVSPFGIINLTAGTSTPGFTGDGGPATAASLVDCEGIAVDSPGNLYITDTGNGRIRKIGASGIITTIAGTGANGFAGDNGPALSAELNQPQGVAVDAKGNIYIADTGNNRIRKVSTSGTITTLAGDGAEGYAGDGVPATAAQLDGPARVTVDGAGNVYFSDNGNNVVRMISPAGIITTVAGNGTSGYSGDGGPATSASLANPFGIAVDGTGSLVIADAGNNVIRRVDGQTQKISTFAGNGTNTLSGDGRPPLQTGFGFPIDVAFDSSGDLHIADRGSGRIRRIQPVPSSLVLSQTGMTFSRAVDAASIASKTITVLNGGAGSIGWSAVTRTLAGGNNWLSVSPAQGTSTSAAASSPLTVSVNPAGLAAGNYYGQIEIVSPGVANSPRFVTVVLSVLTAAQTTGPTVAPAALTFTGVAGGANPAAQTLTVSVLHGAALTFTASLSFGGVTPWLTAQPSSGSVTPTQPAKIALLTSVAGLAAQVYTATLTLSFSGGSVRAVPLTLIVAAPAQLTSGGRVKAQASGCTPAKLIPTLTGIGSGFSLAAGWPAPIDVQVVDDCGQNFTNGTVVAAFSNGDPPLALTSVQNGAWSATWAPRAVASLTITVTAQGSPATLKGVTEVSGQLSANTEPPIIGAGGIVSAASFAAQGTAAPGALTAIFGGSLAGGTAVATSLPLPTLLGGTQVVIGGIAMPLLFVSPTQINAMIPFDLASGSSQQVIVQSGGTLSVPEAEAVAPAAPGPFTLDGSGTGAALVVTINPDGSAYLVTPAHPAQAGATLVIYCTGLGGVMSTIEAGQAVPLAPLAPANDAVSVTMGGVQAKVLFAGLVPTFTGFYQVNAVIPAGVTGPNVSIAVAVGGVAGPTVTVGVE